MPSGLLAFLLMKFFVLNILAYKCYLVRTQVYNILITSILLLALRSLHIIHTPLGTPTNQPNIPAHNNIPSRNSKQKRKNTSNEKDDDDNHIPNPKRKRNSSYHPERSVYSPCALWSQSGSDSQLLQYHPTNNSRHAGTEALSLSQYASFGSTQFNLNYSDCICRPCYMDYMRNRHNSENVIPRWEKVRREAYEQPKISKHCVYCCGTMCECESIVQWGPDCWYGVEGIKVWKQFLSLTGKLTTP